MTTVDELESIVGSRPQAMMMKTIDRLDDGSAHVIARSPIAGFGFRDVEGNSVTTIVGGTTGFAKLSSPTTMSFQFPNAQPAPLTGAGASLVFLLPGIGETLRVAGTVAEWSDETVTFELEEAWVHCAKCILRSGLWHSNGASSSVSPPSTVTLDAGGPLATPSVLAFLRESPFTFISSWDASGASDTTPKGDQPGFMAALDGSTLAIPDRKGNKRTDTFHNLMECDEVSLAAVIPRSDLVLHVRGTGSVTNDSALLAKMALGGKPPHAALVVAVSNADIRTNSAVRDSHMWDESSHIHQSEVPDLMALGARHLAMSKEKGATAAMTRTLGKRLAANPKFLRRGVDHGYQKELKEEGF